MPDYNGYPTEKELEIIRQWNPAKDSVFDLLEHIRSCWNWADERFVLTGKRVLKLYLSTGGWSGNEDIITALHNTFFWFLFWIKSTRGGHYWFRIPAPGKYPYRDRNA